MPHIPEKEYEVALLQLIRQDGNIMFLLKVDDDKRRLLATIDKFVHNGWIVDGQTYRITDKGAARLNELNDELGRKGIYRYIMPDYMFRKPKANPDIPYIPQKKKKR